MANNSKSRHILISPASGDGGTVTTHKEYFKKTQTLADLGDPNEQWKLARCYESGVGIEKNYELAAKYYRMSAIQGFADGQHGLGACYQYGSGTKQNFRKAAKW